MDIAAILTKATGNRIDFFNKAGLAKDRTRDTFLGLWTNYSWREYLNQNKNA